MTEKAQPAHLRRLAVVYVRQSTRSQLERNRESTDRQYALVERAVALGWARESVVVIDEDLGLSGSGTAERSGFARLTTEVALGHVGIVIGLEVSRLARNNADWYRLLDLCGITDTLIGHEDGIYHPASFNDRLVLGLKGTMSEAELYVLRARLEGGEHWTEDHPFVEKYVDQRNGTGLLLRKNFGRVFRFARSELTPIVRLADVIVSIVRRVELGG